MRIMIATLVAATALSAPASASAQKYYARERLVINTSQTPVTTPEPATPTPTPKIDCHSTPVSIQGFAMTGSGWVSSATMPATNMVESAARCEGLNKAGSKYNLCVFYTERAYAILFTNDVQSGIQFGTATIPVQQTTCAIK